MAGWTDLQNVTMSYKNACGESVKQHCRILQGIPAWSEHIFNANEMGHFTIYFRAKHSAQKGNHAMAIKKVKASLCCCCNFDGNEKLKSLATGKSAKPGFQKCMHCWANTSVTGK
jgi:hypothetical protein